MSLKRLSGVLRSNVGTRIPLEVKEGKDLFLKYTKAGYKTFEDLLKDTRQRGSFFPQPARTQPDIEFLREHPEWSTSMKMAKLTAKDVKDWGDEVIADIKYDGIRCLLYVNPKDKSVEVYSRRLKPLLKFGDKYSDAILNNISTYVSEETVFDAELYGTGGDGKLLPYGTIAGWARNPTDVKYDEIVPRIEVFDMMLFNQKDIREMPLKYRKKMLEVAVKRYDGVVLDIADTRLMKNHPRPIEWRFKSVIKGKGEGLVLKKEDSEYFYGKPKGKVNPWRKLKAVDTLDLALKRVEGSPKNAIFKDYRHWIMVPRDNSKHEVRANKGIIAANMDDDFYQKFSLDLINQWKLGKLKAEGKMLPVAAKLKKFYGVDKVPEILVFTPKKRMIVELFIEKMSERLQPSGTKIVGIREDKRVADSMRDIKELKMFLEGAAK